MLLLLPTVVVELHRLTGVCLRRGRTRIDPEIIAGVSVDAFIFGGDVGGGYGEWVGAEIARGGVRGAVEERIFREDDGFKGH